MAITPLPPPPARTDSEAAFASKGDAFLGALPQFVNEVNATAAAMNLNSTNSTSTTPLLVEVAQKSFTVEAAKSYVPGQTVKIAYTSNPTIWMLGDVISYNVSSGVIVVNVQYRQGGGTYSAWTISLSAPAPVTIPSGSVTVWYNATAPVGWTQWTTLTGGHAIRVVSGAGANVGGWVNFTDAFKSRAVTGSNSATSLSTEQGPWHQHTYSDVDNSGTPSAGGSWVGSVGNQTTKATSAAGAGWPHNHAFTGNPIDLTVKYIDMLLAAKD